MVTVRSWLQVSYYVIMNDVHLVLKHVAIQIAFWQLHSWYTTVFLNYATNPSVGVALVTLSVNSKWNKLASDNIIKSKCIQYEKLEEALTMWREQLYRVGQK